MFRVFDNPCLGSFRCFQHQLFAPYQRSPPRRTACPGRQPNRTHQDDAERRHVQCGHCYRSRTAGAGEVWELPQQELPELICQHPEAPAGQRRLSLLQRCKDIAAQLSTRPFDQLAGPRQPTSMPTPRLLQLGLPTSTEGLIKRQEDIKRTQRAQFIQFIRSLYKYLHREQKFDKHFSVQQKITDMKAVARQIQTSNNTQFKGK